MLWYRNGEDLAKSPDGFEPLFIGKNIKRRKEKHLLQIADEKINKAIHFLLFTSFREQDRKSVINKKIIAVNINDWQEGIKKVFYFCLSKVLFLFDPFVL
jgi:hypothetical protein